VKTGRNLLPPRRISARVTSAVPAIAAAESPATATTSAKAALGLRPCLVDVQRATIQGVPVEGGNCLIRLAFIFHFDKCETTRPAGFAIRHNPGAIHLAISFEEAANTLFGGIEVQVAYENILHSVLLSI